MQVIQCIKSIFKTAHRTNKTYLNTIKIITTMLTKSEEIFLNEVRQSLYKIEDNWLNTPNNTDLIEKVLTVLFKVRLTINEIQSDIEVERIIKNIKQ